MHAVEIFPPHTGDVVELTYSLPWGRSAAEWIYLFDQRIARTGIRYQVELQGIGSGSVFVIRVPACHAAVPGRWDHAFGGQVTSRPFLPHDRTRLRIF